MSDSISAIRAAFACNQPRSGHFAGYFEMVDFATDGGSTEVSVIGPRTAIEWLDARIPGARRGDPRKVRVGTRLFPVRGYSQWEGNWCWDGCTMALEDARDLLRFLTVLGFSPDEWGEEGPLADLVREPLRVVGESAG